MRRNGQERPSERPERIIEKLVIAAGLRPPSNVELIEEIKDREWVRLHDISRKRGAERPEAGRFRPGHRARITFAGSVDGPLIFGESAHFGVGAFRAIG